MTRLRQLLPVFFIITIFVPGMIWSQQTGELGLYFSNAVPKGQLLYVISKLTGLYAFFFLMVQLLLSISCRYQLIQLSWMGRLHKITGSVIVLMALAHLLLFFSAVSLRQDHPAWGLFFPNLKDFYHTHLTFGLIGLWLILAVGISGIIRRIRKSPYAQMIHRAYFISVGLIYLHVLAIGTESQSSAGLAFYLGLGGLFVVLLITGLIKQQKIKAAIA